MSVVESRACCVDDAQYMRLQDIMANIEDASPADVIALMRKCATMMGQDIQDGELVCLNAIDAQRYYAAETDGPSPQSLR